MADHSYIVGENSLSFDETSFRDQLFNPLVADSAMSIIDPVVQSPSPAAYNIPWLIPQRPAKEPLFDLSVPVHHQGRSSLDTYPVLQSQIRGGSPIEPPSSRPALSPRADTESHYDGIPMTPPDTTLLSPFQRPLPLDAHAHAMQFTNMGPSYVNPVDVNPSQTLDFGETDNDIAGLYSQPEYASYGMLHSHGMDQSQGAVPGFGSEADSPSEAASQYPAPPNDDEDASNKRPHDSDSDGDYQPSKKQRTVGRVHGRRRGTQGAIAACPSGRRTRTRMSTSRTTGRDLFASSNSNRGTLACTTCSEGGFASETALEAHIKKQHRRSFNCVFHFAGCEATFSSKNEWKRHVMTQHLLLYYWVCTEGACANPQPVTTNTPSSPSSSSSRTPGPLQNAPNGSIFNRKDLFTQHLKRMHAPKEAKDTPKQNDADSTENPDTHNSATQAILSQWSARLKHLQETCKHPRCSLPTHMLCPVRGCTTGPFRGQDAWNLRMEHVAKQHMERAEECGRVVFGGDEDQTLIEWASHPDVAIIERAPEGSGRKWVLKTPLMRGPGGNVVVTAPVATGVAGRGTREEVVGAEIVVGVPEEEEEDAEGEED
ncbi:hypothetical protein VTJ49DRAFT_3179 [Mycothermus thermophilus]|uniref:C2H2-type domain-containing protein n=1 Tax=Humicola insolens TaxID=85995 RepID=A0ABR3V959_HUMIN